MIELKALQGQVKNLVEDLRNQVAAKDDVRAELRQEYADAKSAERIGVTFETWLEDVLDQASVAWVLGCVFIRFCEDNGLVDKLWIGGPEEDASTERAMQAMQGYIIANPMHNDRHWLREGFAHLQGLRATSKIFDKHNPVWRFDISAGAAEGLSDFFRRGAGFRSLRSEDMDTRFLGDLYQDLSAHAQKKYALLQTPEFVEEFILDRTFTPALKEFGLAAMSVIDPTCGSGHFLLGAFHRLLGLWKEREPATPIDILVERSLGQVTGVDLNPFAVAIARFRLVIAALSVTGRTNLNNTYPLRVAAGDSLLHWGKDSGSHQGDLLATLDGRSEFAYYSEDGDLLAEYLRPGFYTVVVGNPPYISVKDKVLNERYRLAYSACAGKYALTVPFAQRFFELAKQGDHDGSGAGLVGQITANSFMKREFGKNLINKYFAYSVELMEIIDTSGAYIPGHGTPTVILVGRNCAASRRYSGLIRVVLGVRGEPSQPRDPAKGLVWSAVVEQIDRPGSDSEWLSVAEFNRDQLAGHPWSLSGGGASDVVELIRSRSTTSLKSKIEGSIGFYAITGDDDVFVASRALPSWHRHDMESRTFVTGDGVRDWIATGEKIVWPYPNPQTTARNQYDDVFWPYRVGLRAGLMFGKTREQRGVGWYEYTLLSSSRVGADHLIAFACVATHNNFTLSKRGPVFNRHAPVIMLPTEAPEDDYLQLLGVLNSSTACFWLKQVSQPKAGGGVGRGMQDEAWEERYEFTGTKLQEFPLPSDYPLELSRRLDSLARQLSSCAPGAIVAGCVPTSEWLQTARCEYESVRMQMISLQEELDWRVYHLYGLIDEDLVADDVPQLNFGERAFEILMARKSRAGKLNTQWFDRHYSAPITELPAHWSTEYRELVERRIAAIESDRNLALIERPECKRRWSQKRDKEVWDWPAQQTAALRDWLLDRLEARALWNNPISLSVAQLADRVRHDEDFRSVLDLWVGTDQHDLAKTLSKLIAAEHVPYLPIDRYEPAGLRKRAQWERTWAKQRREDAGEKVDIDVPPKYASADFKKPSYWRNRGKLDVPKERFISYPRMGRDGDNTELLGWAGWDHLAQARALAGIYLDRKTQAGWPTERLLPMLAGLAELEPWLHQWHNDPAPGFPGSPAEFFTALIDTELSGLDADRHALTKLRGVEELT